MRKLSDFSLRAAIPVGITLLSLLGVAHAAPPADGPPSALGGSTADADKDKKNALDEVIVTGSLIPQVRAETSTPITVITAEDIQNKGFDTVATALQHSSFATGSIQGPGTSGSFTQGAQTVSLFGLSPSFTKFLIDGRPLADYPALYNGSSAINSVSGLPTMLVDHIDILPGAQSSIYGSDAIAGVINIVLKKKAEGFEADFRYGGYSEGGGTDKRVALSDGFNVGPVNVVVGAQWEKTAPIWGYQRSLTNHYNTQGITPQQGELDFLVDGIFGPTGDGTNNYYFEDPANCGNVASLWGNGISKDYHAGNGYYCGTTKGGFQTLDNGTESIQGYLHATDDINEHLQLLAEVLIDHDWTQFSGGTQTNFWDNFYAPYADYYDPRLAGGQGDYVAYLQRIFGPDETGGLSNEMDKDTTNSIRATLGAQGTIAAGFSYTADFTYTETKLSESLYTTLFTPFEAYFANIFGPDLGPDPNGFGLETFEPNYSLLYKPVTPAQWASFNGNITTHSRTEESLARLAITNPTLFPLPGGNAGLAVVGEGGDQGWDYTPSDDLLNGESFLYTSVAGSGHRSRYASTAELKLPVAKVLTFDLSARYDDYKVLGENIDKATYNIGVEFRPHPTVLFRGRYGTAFKAPTLADEFQKPSGSYNTVTDYLQCAIAGYDVAHIGNCTIPPTINVFAVTQGSPDLKPTTAKVSDLGVAWTPLGKLTFTTDFIRYSIQNEIVPQPLNQLSLEEADCTAYTDVNGVAHGAVLNPTSPTCVNALSAVSRDSTGTIVQINNPKVNVSDENLNVLVVGLNYILDTEVAGSFTVEGSYSDILKHTLTQFAGDTSENLLSDPFFNNQTEAGFKTKENLSLTWNFHNLGLTGYVERYGRTPNYVATESAQGYSTPYAGNVGSWTLVNFSANYRIYRGLTVYGNIVNAFNKMPPFDGSYDGGTYLPYNQENYNPYGRSFYVGANYKFGKGQ